MITRSACKTLEQVLQRRLTDIDIVLNALRAMQPASTEASPADRPHRPYRFSPEQRARHSEMMRARWRAAHAAGRNRL